MIYFGREEKKTHHLRNFLIMSLLLIGVIIYFHDAIVFPNIKLDYQKTISKSVVNPIWPDYGSGRVEVVGFSENVIYHGSQTARPIASITKVITALVVLDKKPLDGPDDEGSMIYLSDADQKIYNTAVANDLAVKPLSANGKISEKQAMQIMLMASAANYAETLAVWAYGSVDEYIIAANDWLKANNLLDTKVVDTTGLDNRDISTPSDLIKLGKLALKNRAVSSIVSTKEVEIDGVGKIGAGNRVLGKLGVNGIKTGFTGDAGACLLFSSTIKVGGQNIEMIGNLLGGEDSATVASDVEKLLKSIQSAIRYTKIISKNQEFGTVSNIIGQKSKIIATGDVSAVVWSNVPIKQDVKIDNSFLPRVGEKAGIIESTINGKIFKTDLIYQ